MKNVIVNSSPMAVNSFEHEMFPEITLKLERVRNLFHG